KQPNLRYSLNFIAQQEHQKNSGETVNFNGFLIKSALDKFVLELKFGASSGVGNATLFLLDSHDL
ncbi:MAG: hypothetical protein ABW202_11090, partial [Duganella sp.]